MREPNLLQKDNQKNRFLEKFKGKVNKVSKLGLNALIFRQKSEEFQGLQENSSHIAINKIERQLSLVSQKVRSFQPLERISLSRGTQQKMIQKSTSLVVIKKSQGQKLELPKLPSSQEMRRKLSLEGHKREVTKSQERINKIIKSSCEQTQSKYQIWNVALDVNEDNLRYFKFTSGKSKMTNKQFSGM